MTGMKSGGFDRNEWPKLLDPSDGRLRHLIQPEDSQRGSEVMQGRVIKAISEQFEKDLPATSF